MSEATAEPLPQSPPAVPAADRQRPLGLTGWPPPVELLTDKPQAFLGAPREWYDELQGINSSLLKAVHSGPPLRAYLEYLAPDREPREETPAFRIGTYLHGLLLEPLVAEATWISPPADAPRRPTDKQLEQPSAKPGTKTHDAWRDAVQREDWWRDFDRKAEGKVLVDAKEFRSAQKMADAVRGHGALGPLFPVDDPAAHLLNEVTLTWLDPTTGLRCKARLDAIRFIQGLLWVLDLKTTMDAGPVEFGKSAANYDYLIQGAFYADALFHCKLALAEAIGVKPEAWIGVPIGFEFIAIDKGIPCSAMVARYWMEGEQFQVGRRLYREALNTAAACMSTGYWPGYNTAAQPLTLPRWYNPE